MSFRLLAHSHPLLSLWTLRIGVGVSLGGLCALTAWSQSPAPKPATVQAEAATYSDRVLDSGAQQDAVEEAEDPYNTNGWARSLRLEQGLTSERGASRSLQRALAFGGFLDTPNHGALSLNASLTRLMAEAPNAGTSLHSSGSTWRVEQRAMPLDGGWYADHSAGDISTLAPALARGTGRISLPTTPISGITGQWSQRDTASLNLAVGKTGLFSGTDIAGFQSSGGGVLSGGGQLRLADGPGGVGRLEAAGQWVQANHMPESGIPGGRNTQSLWSSLVWQGKAPWADQLEGNASAQVAGRAGGLRVQGNWLHSDSNLGSAANGYWLDGTWRSESLQHNSGLFRFDPGLRWGPTVAASDLEGFYWRAETSSRRWQWGWSFEGSTSVSGATGAGAFGNVYGSYRLDSRNNLGATLALRSGNGAAQSMQARWDRTADWGQTQLRASALRGQQAHTVFVGVDQIWATGLPATFSSSLGWQQSRGDAGVASNTSWGLLSGYSPLAGMSLDASLRGAVGAGTTALNAAIGAAWQVRRNWTLTARYNDARGQEPQLAQVVSALTAATQTPVVAVVPQRSIQLLLRFEERAGSGAVPLGGFVGAGAGRLAGTVFFDANKNGLRDASEAGAPNISVVLNRRFVARTDSQGRYEFPFVVAGEHVIEVQIDNVPLPWTPVARDPVKTTVYVRESTTMDFALQRDGGELRGDSPGF